MYFIMLLTNMKFNIKKMNLLKIVGLEFRDVRFTYESRPDSEVLKVSGSSQHFV